MKQFKTQSKRLLDLMINSIYTNHEIFLRELLSNASDALDKLTLESADDAGVDRSELGIYVAFDKQRRLLTVSDNGIGMSEEALEKNLGTIAHSGSLEFKGSNAKNETAKAIDIIGQFGVGFYSSFMVADHVTVVSRAYGSSEAFQWESNGKDGYNITPATRATRGTDVILHVRESTEEENLERYLDQLSLQGLIKRYSNYIRYPIRMEVETAIPKLKLPSAGATQEEEMVVITETKIVNSMVPIWTKKRAEVSDEEYNEFYKSDFHDVLDPLRTISVHAEGSLDYDALLFIPREIPEHLFGKGAKGGLSLYSSSVLITDNCAKLLPDYFGFVRGVVDTRDLNLNVSREMLQEDHQLERIERQLEKKIAAELGDMRDNDRAAYIDFFDVFGHSFKYAIYTSEGILNEILNDFLIFTSANEQRPVTFAEYVEAAKDAAGAEDTVIYYATGDDVDRLAQAPSVQIVLEKGYDVLLCSGGIQDEFCFMTLGHYKGMDFCNVASGTLDLSTEEERLEAKRINDTHAGLFDLLLENTPDEITKVIASTRLVSAHGAASCITTDGSVTLAMARFLSTRPEKEDAPQPEYILEINTHHPLFTGLLNAYEAQENERVGYYATVLLDEALLAEDIAIDDPLAFSTAINALIA